MKTIKGKPKSGRIWKADKKKKSEMINVKPLHSSWERKKLIRAEKDSIKAFEREMKEAARKERDEKRKRIEERKKRKEENQRKSEIVQEDVGCGFTTTSYVEKKTDKPAQIQALNEMGKRRPTFPINILNAIQKAEHIKNTSKLKRLKKKQLRLISKR